MECFWHIFGTLIGDKDQTLDEDEVQILVTFGDHLVEIKGFKEGFKVIHQVKSIIWINQIKSFHVSIKNGALERPSLPMCGMPPNVWDNRAHGLEG